MRLDNDRFSKLVQLIYSAATDSARWLDVTEALGQTFEAPYTLIFGFSPRNASVLYAASWGLPADALKQYEQTYAALDIRAPAALHARAGSVLTDETMVDRRAYRASPIYNEYLHPLEAERLLTVVPHNSSGRHAIVSINRSNRAGAFDAQEGQFLSSLVPHFERALLISEKLAKAAIASRLSEEVTTRVPFGVITLASGGSIVEANQIAERLLQENKLIASKGGRVVACDGAVNDRLQKALSEAERTTGSPRGLAPDVVVASGSGEFASVCFLVVPLITDEVHFNLHSPRTAMFIFNRGDRLRVDPGDLTRVYGVTCAEARVLGQLVAGYTVAETAHRLSLSVETVRTHLKRILAKIHCESQAALIRTILLGPVPVMRVLKQS